MIQFSPKLTITKFVWHKIISLKFGLPSQRFKEFSLLYFLCLSTSLGGYQVTASSKGVQNVLVNKYHFSINSNA